MHWFDVGTGIALLIGGVRSVFRGLVREVVSVLGITTAFVLSFHGYLSVAQHLTSVTASLWLRQATGFALIFLSITVLYVLLAALLHRLLTVAGLSVPNRLLGGLFGLLKVTVVIAALCIITAQFFPTFVARLTTGSLLAPTFFRVADSLATLLPPGAVEQFQGVSKRLRQQVPAWMSVPPTPSASRTPASAQDGISESDARALEKLLRQQLETK